MLRIGLFLVLVPRPCVSNLKNVFLKFSRSIYWSSAFIKTYISQADLSQLLQNSAAVADFRFVWDLILTSDSPRIDLTLHTGSPDSSVPIAINKSWNIQDLAVLFLSVRQHPCLLYILSLSRRGCSSAPLGRSLRVSHCINVYFYSFQVSPLMLTYYMLTCTCVGLSSCLSQGSSIFWLPSLEAPSWQAGLIYDSSPS